MVRPGLKDDGVLGCARVGVGAEDGIPQAADADAVRKRGRRECRRNSAILQPLDSQISPLPPFCSRRAKDRTPSCRPLARLNRLTDATQPLFPLHDRFSPNSPTEPVPVFRIDSKPLPLPPYSGN